MIINLILEKTNTGYSAYSNDLQGVVTAGDTFDEIKENYTEALSLYIEYLEENNQKSDAEQLKKAQILYHLDLKTFFEYYSLFNKSELASYLGINPSHLRRLSSKNIELSQAKAEQIQNGLLRLSNDLKQIRFA